MDKQTSMSFEARIAYYLRRAAQEREKAAAACSERERRGRVEIAEIFEARARDAPTLH
jgi:hypothetical protein